MLTAAAEAAPCPSVGEQTRVTRSVGAGAPSFGGTARPATAGASVRTLCGVGGQSQRAHASPEEADSQGRPVVVPGLEVGTRGAAVSWAQSSSRRR